MGNNNVVRILVTGSGGIGGTNFVRALRLAEKQDGRKYFIVGTDYNPYHILFPEIDVKVRSPKHSDPSFMPLIAELVRKYSIDFIHPHPSSEAKVVAQNIQELKELGVRFFLPPPIDIAPDKFTMYLKLRNSNVPVPKTIRLRNLEDIDDAFRELGSPLWIRAIKGAGGRLSLKISTPEEGKLWVKLNVIQGRAEVRDFIVQEYLPGSDLAFDSLWHKGKLVTSYVRERLEYPFKHISLTGITGTPTVAKTVENHEATAAGIAAVRALNPKPHGFYSVDLKCGGDGKPRVTEVDGKWHTTAPLWSYAMSKVFGKPEYNIVYAYLRLGLGEDLPYEPQSKDLFPSECYLIRQLDSGVILKCGDRHWKVL